MERKRPALSKTKPERATKPTGLAASITTDILEKLLVGRTFYTERGYDAKAGDYRYVLCIVLAEGEQAILE